MTPLSLFLTVASAHLLVVASPGPDFAVVLRQTLSHGRSAGLWTAWGIASGILGHVAWAMFGLGWVVQRWPVLLVLLQLAGAGVLLWIGWGALRARPHAAAPDAAAVPPAAGHHYLTGLATNLLNAKAMLFFIALCSTVIGSATPLWLKLGLGCWMVLSTGLWFSFAALTLGLPAVRIRLLGVAHWIDRCMGVILILLALAMLLTLLCNLD